MEASTFQLKLDVLDENTRAPKTDPSKPSSSARTQRVDSSKRHIGARRRNSPRASFPRASSPRNVARKNDPTRSLTLDQHSSPRTSSTRASSPRTLVSKKDPTKSSTADQHSSSRSRTRQSPRSSSPRPASSRSRNCASPRSTSRSASPRSEQYRRSPRSAKLPQPKDWIPASASGLSGGRRVKSANDERSFLAGSTTNSCGKSPAAPKTKVYKDWIPASSRGLSGGRRVESSRDRRSYLAGSCDDLFASSFSSSDQRAKSLPASPSSKLAKTKVFKDWIPASSRGLSGGRRVDSSRDRRSYLAGSCDDLFASNSASHYRRVYSTPSTPTRKSSTNILVNSWVPASASGLSGGRRVKSIDDERSFLAGSTLNEETKLLTPAKAKVYMDWIPASSRGFSGGRQAESSIDRRSYLAGVRHDEDLLDSSPRATRNAHNRRSRSKKASSGSQQRSKSQNNNGSKSTSPRRRQDWIPASSRGLSGGALSKTSPKVAEYLVAGHREGDGNVAAHRVSKLTVKEKIKVAAERSAAAERRRIVLEKAAEEEALLERRQRYKMIVAQGTSEDGTSCNKHDTKVISILSHERDETTKQKKEKPTESEGDAEAIKKSKHEAKGSSLDGSFSTTASPAQRIPSSSQSLVISSGLSTSESSSLQSSSSSSSSSLSSSSSFFSPSSTSSLRQHYTNRSAGARSENAIAREQLALRAKELVAKSQYMRAKQRHAQQPPRGQKVPDLSSKDNSASRIDSGSNPLDIKVPISQMMDAMSSLDLEAAGQVTNMEMTSVVSEEQQRTREQSQKFPMQ